MSEFSVRDFIHCIVKNLSSDLFVKRKVIAETKYHTIIARENNIWNRWSKNVWQKQNHGEPGTVRCKQKHVIAHSIKWLTWLQTTF